MTPPIELQPFVIKSVSIHSKMMFTRAMFHTSDMAEQGRLVSAVMDLVDAGNVRAMLSGGVWPINEANLVKTHRQVEPGSAIGKWVLVGF